MNKVQGNLPTTDGAPVLPEPMQGDTFAFMPTAQGEPRMAGGADEGAGMNEHSLLSRPAAPGYRRSLFRR